MYKNVLLLIGFIFAGLGLFQVIDFLVESHGKKDLSFTQKLVVADSYRAVFQNLNDTRTHLLITVCVQCHDVPSPEAHTAQEWPAVVSEMLQQLDAKQRANPSAQKWIIPTKDEKEKIIAYLSEYAKKDE